MDILITGRDEEKNINIHLEVEYQEKNYFTNKASLLLQEYKKEIENSKLESNLFYKIADRIVNSVSLTALEGQEVSLKWEIIKRGFSNEEANAIIEGRTKEVFIGKEGGYREETLKNILGMVRETRKEWELFVNLIREIVVIELSIYIKEKGILNKINTNKKTMDELVELVYPNAVSSEFINKLVDKIYKKVGDEKKENKNRLN